MDSEEAAPLDVAENRPERRENVSVCTCGSDENISTQQAMLRSVAPCLDTVKGKRVGRELGVSGQPGITTR